MPERENTARPTIRRLVALAALVTVVFGVFAVQLYRIQIVEHDEYAARAEGSSTLTLSVAASRGEILDCNLTSLVENQTAYAVVLDYNYFPTASTAEGLAAQNRELLALTALLEQAGESWNDTLPLSAGAPYTFAEGRDSSVDTLKGSLRLGDYATAENCMAALVETYGLQDYTPAEQRRLAGIQYEMALRQFGAFNAYVLASGVSKETSYLISENSADFPGVEIQTTAVRNYVSGDTASHLIGLVGPIYAEEYAELKEKGYALNDTVGKSGVESAFESVLRGQAGRRVLVKNRSGKVVDEYESLAPTPGDTVVLTLDSALQATAQQALADKIAELRAKPATSGGSFLNNGHDVASGSVVVLDVKNGGVLTAATWPNYDLSTYQQDYEELLKDADHPLFNRALNGAFACGSTMKPGVAAAALNEGVLSPTATYYCGYTYNRFASGGLVLHCMGHHSNLNVVTALEKSCNIFFYELSQVLGIEQMNRYSAVFGLGQITGIEVGEARGVLAGATQRESAGGTWSAADTAGAAIGQSDNLFTPIQLATYAMTLANNGTRYKTHLLHSRLSYDGTVVETAAAETADAVTLSQEAVDTVKKGMVAVATSGTASYYFRSTAYSVACKTGTAQVSGTKSDHGVFIAYAPADDPQVAIAVVMENGTSGAATAVARTVLDAYFEAAGASDGRMPYGELLP